MVPARRAWWPRAPLLAALAVSSGCDCGPTGHRLPDVVVDASAIEPPAPTDWTRGLPDVRWVQRLHTPKLVAHADGAGNVVIAATLDGPAAIGGRQVRPRLDGGQDILVASLDAQGAARWTTVLGSDGLDTVADLAVDARGFVTVTGSYGAPFPVGGGTLELDPEDGAAATYVMRLDPAGVAVAARGPLSPGDRTLAATEDGVVLATGTAQIDVEVLDGKLAPRWRARCEREEEKRAPAVAFAAGVVILAGDTTGAARPRCVVSAPAPAAQRGRPGNPAKALPPTTGAGGSALFAARLREGGSVEWLRGVDDGATLAGLAVAPDGRMAIGMNGPNHSLVRMLGALEISSRFLPESDGSVRVAAVAIDDHGDVAVAADFAEALEVVGKGVRGARLVALGRDVMVARLTASGRPLWARRFGDERDQRAEGVALDAAGNVVVVGREASRQGGDRSAEDWFVMALSP
jgi:hypothetical protein